MCFQIKRFFYVKMLLSRIIILCMYYSQQNIFCTAIKKHIFLKRDIISLIELRASNIFMPNGFFIKGQ